MDNVITVNELQPYTQYVFQSAVETVYNQRLGIKSFPGPSSVFTTKAKGVLLLILYLHVLLCYIRKFKIILNF